MKTSFRDFQTAKLPATTSDAIGFFEAIALAGLEGQYVRIPAATQRKHFGSVPFGKLAVRVDGNVCQTIKCMAYGSDFDTQSAYWSMAENAWRSEFNHNILPSFPTN